MLLIISVIYPFHIMNQKYCDEYAVHFLNMTYFTIFHGVICVMQFSIPIELNAKSYFKVIYFIIDLVMIRSEAPCVVQRARRMYMYNVADIT